MMQYIWLAFVILFVVAEGMTVGLVSIWFAGGSLVAMLLAMAGAGIGWQMLAFLFVSAKGRGATYIRYGTYRR